MLRLDTTTRKLQVLLGGNVTTNQLDVLVSYSDATSTSYTGGNQGTATNDSAVVDICDSPDASIVRDIDHVSIRNNDTVSDTITLRYDDNGTFYKIIGR